MLHEVIAYAGTINKALKVGLNHPRGPSERVILGGLDTRLHILEYLHKSLGEKFRPCPLLVQYVTAGSLGRKPGRGMVEYPGFLTRASETLGARPLSLPPQRRLRTRSGPRPVSSSSHTL